MAASDASGINSGGLLANLVQDWLDSKLPVAMDTVSIPSGNTTSTNFTTLKSTTVSVESDELILVMAQMSLSHGTGNGAVNIRLDIDGSTNTQSNYQENTADTGGNRNYISMSHSKEDSSGVITIKVEWKTDTGTAYSGSGDLYIYRWKRR